MWFNRYNSLKFKVHFSFQVNMLDMQSRPEYSVIMNQYLHNFLVNTSNFSAMNVSCRLGI